MQILRSERETAEAQVESLTLQLEMARGDLTTELTRAKEALVAVNASTETNLTSAEAKIASLNDSIVSLKAAGGLTISPRMPFNSRNMGLKRE